MATITLTKSLKIKEERNNDERSLHGENKNTKKGPEPDSSAPKTTSKITTQPFANASGPEKAFNNINGKQNFSKAKIKGGRKCKDAFNNNSNKLQSFEGAHIDISGKPNSDGPTAVDAFNNKGEKGIQLFDGATID